MGRLAPLRVARPPPGCRLTKYVSRTHAHARAHMHTRWFVCVLCVCAHCQQADTCMLPSMRWLESCLQAAATRMYPLMALCKVMRIRFYDWWKKRMRKEHTTSCSCATLGVELNGMLRLCTVCGIIAQHELQLCAHARLQVCTLRA